MATLREIKLRIRSIKSTQKITKAMEMVAASKMRKAQIQALKGRPYLEKLEEVIQSIVSLSDPPLTHPLLQPKPAVKRIGYIFLTSNRGLCGSFNSSIIRTMFEILAEKNETEEIVITLGRKGRQAMERIGKKILADFENIKDQPSLLDTLGISGLITNEFLNGHFDEVWVVYNHFYSILSQKPVAKKILPIEPSAELESKTSKTKYLFEGDPAQVLDQLLKRYVSTVVYQTVLESLASEQSARMMAMHKASDNAKEIVENLTLDYNKGRQAKITGQILEVVSGSEATG